MQSFDHVVDVVVVGSGASGTVAALVAKSLGLNVLILEKGSMLGGSMALSSAGMWIPNNRFMREQRIADSFDDALRYLNQVIEDVGPASSQARRRAFLTNANLAIGFLESIGLKVQRVEQYSDYYPDVPGGSARGRCIEPQLFDLKKLGEWADRLPPRVFPRTLPLTTAKLPALYLAARTWKGWTTFISLYVQAVVHRLRGREVVGVGLALAGQLLFLVRQLGIPLWWDTPAGELILEGDRVVGVVAMRDGQQIRIGARRAVHLGAGGFAQNLEMRRKYQPMVGGRWSSANPNDQGDAIRMGADVGAELALMDDAWWGPSSIFPDGRAVFQVAERAKPGSIIVDQSGTRYMNEAQSYVDACHIMFKRNETVAAVPSWLVFDTTYRNRYPFAALLPGRTPAALIEAGYFKKADTLEELAGICGLQPATFVATVRRFNEMALKGVDEDFHRGRSHYDHHYGDPRIRPNPNLAPIDKAPFFAVAMYPGDLGTKGGLLTDEFARVLRPDGTPIAGLYAAGNTTASVMGRTYPGPGATLGPAITFSFIAMQHAASH